MGHSVSQIISDETLSRGIQIESGGNAKARAPTSSAAGLAQFVNATWLAIVRQHRPDWIAGRTESQVLTLRFDPACAIEMMARLWEDNAAMLGTPVSDGDLYLAHFAGALTARRLAHADASAPCGSVFGAAAIAANGSILAGKSCGEVRAWAVRKMAAAGGRNWIAVHLHGAKPIGASARKTIAAGAVAGTTATVAIGAQHHGSHWPWLVAAFVLIGVVISIVAILRWKKVRLPDASHTENKHGMG